MEQALNAIAALLTNDKCDCMTLNWASLRYQHTARVERFSPHDFRRTFCSDLLDAGVDIVTVQKLAEQASPATTGKYDQRGEETKRKAMEKLDIGYTQPRSLD